METQLQLGDITVDVVLKEIKNVHLSVYPPTGRVRISAPARMDLDTIRVYAISRLDWIKRQQKKLRKQARETPREYIDRESHYVWGKRYLLQVVQADQPSSVELGHKEMLLRVRLGSDESKRQAVVEQWYRGQLKQAVPPLIALWEPRPASPRSTRRWCLAPGLRRRSCCRGCSTAWAPLGSLSESLWCPVSGSFDILRADVAAAPCALQNEDTETG